MEEKKVVVNSEMENMRLDRYLRKQFKNESLSKIFSAIRNGDVKVNAKKSKESYRLSLGDILTIKMLKSSEKKENNFEKIKIKKENIENYKKMIIFENKDFFIVNKKEKVINFFEDYCVALKSIESCLSKDGYLIMTVGNRSIDAIRQPLDKITIEIAENLGLKIISKFNRNILYKKTPLTLSSGKNEKVVKSISEETILIFTK